MYFFEPYSPGELTFYGLIYGGYKLHEKLSDRRFERDLARHKLDERVAAWLSAEEWIETVHPETSSEAVQLSMDLISSLYLSRQERIKREYFLKRRFGYLDMSSREGSPAAPAYEEMKKFFYERWTLKPIVYDPEYRAKEKAAEKWIRRGHRLKNLEDCETLRTDLLESLKSAVSEEEVALIEDRLWALMTGRYFRFW